MAVQTKAFQFSNIVIFSGYVKEQRGWLLCRICVSRHYYAAKKDGQVKVNVTFAQAHREQSNEPRSNSSTKVPVTQPKAGFEPRTQQLAA